MYTAIKIDSTIVTAHFSARRAFFKLDRIKYETNGSQEHYTDLIVLCSESDISDVLKFNETIREFGSKKVREKIRKKIIFETYFFVGYLIFRLCL